MYIALLAVKSGLILSHLPIHRVDDVHTRVTFQLVPTSNVPQQVLLVETLAFSHSHWQTQCIYFPIRFVSVCEVKSFN